jgi:hypothetical protein
MDSQVVLGDIASPRRYFAPLPDAARRAVHNGANGILRGFRPGIAHKLEGDPMIPCAGATVAQNRRPTV